MKTILVLGVLLFVAGSAIGKNPCGNPPHNFYSKRAVDQGDRVARAESPDGQKAVIFWRVDDPRDPDGWHTNFTVRVGNKVFKTKLLGFSAEVLWAPDSSAFAVTETEGGGSIGYGGYVFYVRPSGLVKLDLSPLVAKAFSNPAKCDIAPNIAIVDWLDGSDRILTVAETIPVSACDCMGMFEAFEVSLPTMRIVRKHTQLQAKRKFWDVLGCELRTADDTCAKKQASNEYKNQAAVAGNCR